MRLVRSGTFIYGDITPGDRLPGLLIYLEKLDISGFIRN